MAGRVEVALEVHRDDGVPVGLVHVEDHLVAEDAGVVDDDVEPAERLDRLVDHRPRAGERRDVAGVGDRLTAPATDHVDDGLGDGLVGALTARRAAEVVDDDLGPGIGQLHRVPAPDAVPSASDDGHLAIEDSHEI